MHLTFQNVNAAFTGLVMGIRDGDIPTVRTSSRNGDVLQVVDPITVTYMRPRQRVLINAARDCNPFFHLYESLWMLAGRNDVAPLSYYNSHIATYSDNGFTFNGAYGYRWRRHSMYGAGEEVEGSAVDQLELLVKHLQAYPDSRRAVLSMWTVPHDLMKVGGLRVCPFCKGTRRGSAKSGSFPAVDASYACPTCEGTGTEPASKDVCCNLSVMFSCREEQYSELDPRRFKTFEEARQASLEKYGSPDYARKTEQCCVYREDLIRRVLDMTVVNRSNDLVWGMLGANVVHFSMLQEYLANRLEVVVGKYHHITNNLHVYLNNWHPDKWLRNKLDNHQVYRDDCSYMQESLELKQGTDSQSLDLQICKFAKQHASHLGLGSTFDQFDSLFLEYVAKPMMEAWGLRKILGPQDLAPLKHLMHSQEKYKDITTKRSDWLTAGLEWMERRLRKQGVDLSNC